MKPETCITIAYSADFFQKKCRSIIKKNREELSGNLLLLQLKFFFIMEAGRFFNNS